MGEVEQGGGSGPAFTTVMLLFHYETTQVGGQPVADILFQIFGTGAENRNDMVILSKSAIVTMNGDGENQKLGK